MKINEITDPKLKTKTKTAAHDFSDLENMFKDMDDNTAHKQLSQKSNTSISHKVADKAETQKKTANVTMHPDASAHIANLYKNMPADADSQHTNTTTGDSPKPPKPETMPALISKAMAKTDNNVELNWHQVKNLPGYMKAPIRQLGKQVFAAMTDTPIDQIQVMANLGGQGPNSTREIMAFGGWLKQNGIEDNKFTMDFEETMPGYKAEVALFNTENMTFMLVQDFAGQYVYGWPGGRGVQIADKSAETKKLK